MVNSILILQSIPAFNNFTHYVAQELLHLPHNTIFFPQKLLTNIDYGFELLIFQLERNANPQQSKNENGIL